MKKILLISLSMLFAGEMEVDGDLKVTGQIDASNQRVKNVGIPQELTDAINGNILQDALRDDTQYEYTFFMMYLSISSNSTSTEIYSGGFLRLDYDNFTAGTHLRSMSTFSSEITMLMNDGWKLSSINGDGVSSWWIFKKPLDE